jgi:hypothetical protein
LVNFTLNSKNDGEKEIFISSFVLVLIFCYNLCIIIFFIIIIPKTSFFYVIYAKDGRKKTYLFDKTYFIPMNLIGTLKSTRKRKLISIILVLILIGF